MVAEQNKLSQTEDIIVRLRWALIIYLSFIVSFNLFLKLASLFTETTWIYHSMVYFSFLIVVAGGLLVSIYSQKDRKVQQSQITSNFSKAFAAMAYKIDTKIKDNSSKKAVDLLVKNRELESELKEAKQTLNKLSIENKKILKQNSLFKKEKQRLSKKVEQNNPFNREKEEVVKKVKKLGWIKKRYPRLPQKKEKRAHMYKEIAKSVEAQKGVFTYSDMMEILVDHFSDEVDDDRKSFLKEIQESIRGSEDTPLVKKEKGVSLFTTIKYGGEK